MATIQSKNLVYERGFTETLTVDGATALTAGQLLVEAGSGVWGTATAIDGTGRVAVLLEDTEVGQTVTIGALSGWFNRDNILYPASQTWDDVKVYLQQFGIHLTPATQA